MKVACIRLLMISVLKSHLCDSAQLPVTVVFQ